ncbi:TetR family transcriptional regulator C-terminal domain-containing protein [Streptomyces xiangluensis]|uniref:TetR family transcriptional regulator C-terminal domain-containing protein n=1 Tax=Streptomyces xiangluensis TaxID=2665720 RepID=A0ABV8YJZ5_9ACTN
MSATHRKRQVFWPHRRRPHPVLRGFRWTGSPAARHAYAKLHGVIAWLIRYGQDTREVPQRLDPDCEAHTLLALADGLTVRVLAGHQSPATALAILQRHIDHLLENASDRG